MSDSNEGCNYITHPNREMQIRVPRPDCDNSTAINDIDWNRLKKDIERCKTFEIDYTWLIAFFAGAGITFGASAFPLSAANNLSSWVLPTYIISAIAFFALSIITGLFNRSHKQSKEKRIDDILDYMNDIDQRFQKEKENKENFASRGHLFHAIETAELRKKFEKLRDEGSS